MANSAIPAMGTPVVKRQYGLPCVWIHLRGLTFRWGQPDGYVTVLRGTHCGRETDFDFVAKFSVPSPWLNAEEARILAQRWLQRNPQVAA